MLLKKFISFSATSLLMTTLGSISMILAFSQTAAAADLTVNIGDITKGKGHVMVAVYAGEEDFTKGKSVFASKVKANNEQEQVIFKDLPDGEYAIKMYQDENSNQKLDFNFIGIPKEGYGFSNNVGKFGPPEYHEAKFLVANSTVISVELL